MSDLKFDIIKLHSYASPVFFVFVTERPLKSIIIRFYFDVSVKNASFAFEKTTHTVSYRNSSQPFPIAISFI